MGEAHLLIQNFRSLALLVRRHWVRAVGQTDCPRSQDWWAERLGVQPELGAFHQSVSVLGSKVAMEFLIYTQLTAVGCGASHLEGLPASITAPQSNLLFPRLVVPSC